MCTAMPATSSPTQLALAGVQTGPDVQPQPLDLVDDLGRAANGARRAVEGGQEAVADRLDLRARASGASSLRTTVSCCVEQLRASGCRRARSARSVEPTMSVNMHGCEDPIDLRDDGRAAPGEELLDVRPAPATSVQP